MAADRLAPLAPAALALFMVASPVAGVEIVLINLDGAGEGFNDLTPVAPVPGNPFTTRGDQRLFAFQSAAEEWGETLASPVEIKVGVEMDALACSRNSGLLGQAGATSFFRDFDGAPPGVWLPAALADDLAGEDLDPLDVDIVAVFNSAVDDNPNCLTGLTWSYAVGSPAPDDQVSYHDTVLHELAHGLGFTTLVDLASGAKAQGLDDVFMRHLEDHSTGKGWSQMTNVERRHSAVDDGDLHWVGPAVAAASGALSAGRTATGHVAMYAPNPIEEGSSVSHWDVALTPDELMEPFATPDELNVVTTAALEDLGWQLQGCAASETVACLNQERFTVSIDWRDQRGLAGQGQALAVPGIGDSGLFYFFDEDNVEMLVKVLDGCGLNNHFWVFFAATTDVEFSLTVTDSLSGTRRTYFNELGHAADAVTDTTAFATCSLGAARTPPSSSSASSRPSRERGLAPGTLESPAPSGEMAFAPLAACVPDAFTLCLNQGRFAIDVHFDSGTSSGDGQRRSIPGIDDSGLFTFFDPQNLEMLIKVLNACGINDRFWVLFAATTDVEFEVTVTDTVTGTAKSYFNELGHPASAEIDTDAFATCDG